MGFDSLQFNAPSLPESRSDVETLNASANWAMQSLIVSGRQSSVYLYPLISRSPTCRVEPSGRNPNKALMTINQSGVVLMANKIAGELLCCQVCRLPPMHPFNVGSQASWSAPGSASTSLTAASSKARQSRRCLCVRTENLPLSLESTVTFTSKPL
jgi:hypothetical protein